MNFRVHDFVSNDVNVLTFRPNHDADAAADELCTTAGIEPERAKPGWLIEEHKYWVGFTCAEATFNSRAGIPSECNIALLIDLRFTSRERTIGEPMKFG